MLWGYSCDLGVVLEDKQVYFTTDTKLWEIDAWLNGAAGAWEEDAVVLSLIVVQVGAVGVEGGADAVASTVDEVVRVASLGDYPACDVIYLPALDGLVFRQSLAHEGDGRVSYSFHDLKDFALCYCPFHVWGYWREFVQSSLARLDLAQFTLPLFLIGQAPQMVQDRTE